MDSADKLAPLYARVRQTLLDRIEVGIWAEGDFLPTEPELCAEMGVSRITIRRAVKELCDEGLLIRQQGRGTVVARHKVQQTLVSLSGFSDSFEAEGPVTHTVHAVTESDGDTAARAALGTRAPTRIDRLIAVNGRPFTLEALFLDPARTGAAIGPVQDGASFFQTLRQMGGAQPASAERILNVGFANPAERRLLQIGPTQPVFRIDKTLRDDEGQPLAFSRLVTPTHLISYSLRS